MMHSPVDHPLRLFVKRRRRLLFNLFVIVATVLTLFPKARPAYAQATPGPINPCDIIPIPFGVICTNYPPPELLYLKQRGLYTATVDQTTSLRNLENQAVATVLALHSLPPEDADAARTWGRDDVLAQLYSSLVSAIDTPAASRTTDQQNAIDWITAVAKRQNVAAAQNAAREYVKWAGLNRSNFDALIGRNPTKAEIQAYLSGTVVNYDLPPPDATEGWCAYRSPAPYGDEYQGYNNPLCIGPFIGLVLPPTPTYEQFVKWGEAKASYLLLSNPAYLSRGQTLGISMGVLLPVAAAIAGYASYTVALVEATRAAKLATDTLQAARAVSVLSGASTFLVLSGLTLATTILIAVATAIIVGINVTDAANLPGKLATLIDTTNATTPDPATFINSSAASTSLFSLFVAATTPAPSLNSCDNSIFLAPGMYELTIVGTDTTQLTDSTPCLNPTKIPAATATDPQFLVTTQSSGAQALAPSITVKDTTSNSTTTAQLRGNWFITTANGTTAQTLRLAYTDWDGKQQNTWLVGNPTNGYTFLTFSPPADASVALSPATCIADGTCGTGAAIKYIGADGQKYSATVRPYQAPTGAPTASPNAVEGSPSIFDANGFAPGAAVAPITYQWSFKGPFCNPFICTTEGTASGPTVTYSWQTSGTYLAEVTATDALGVQATTNMLVPVSAAPPTLTLAPDCAASPNVPCNTLSGNVGSSIALRGTVGFVGGRDYLRVTVNWGDGSEYIAYVALNDQFLVGTQIALTPSASQLAYTMLTPHAYANPGVYNGTVTVTNVARQSNVLNVNGAGPTVSQPFTVNVIGPQTITFPNIGGHSYGDVFSIAATGGASGQPVTFATNSSCTLSNISGGPGTGSATVTVTSAGFCDIIASQAGTTSYNPAPDVRQRVFTLLAVLTVTAPSPNITYGEAIPTLTPNYSGFKNSDTASVLTTPATCVVAPNSGTAGAYATSCSGAAAPNYSVNYVPGTLRINPAPLTITANDKTITYGGAAPAFNAQANGFVNGDISSVVSGLSCSAKDANGQPVGNATAAGSYPITCAGGSAANYSLSYVPGTLTIAKAATSTTLSAAPNAAVYGQPVTFTVAVSINGPGAGRPGGTVAFYDGGSAIAGCAAQPVDPVSGTATCTTAGLSVTQHTITAVYSGDANFVSSTTAPLEQTVNKAAVTTTLGAAVNPSIAGQAVIFSATVAATAPGAGTPSGTVTFKRGATTLGTGMLTTSNGATAATFTTSSLAVGQYTISASYGGNDNFLAGSVVTFTQYVNTNLSSYPRLPSGAYNLIGRNLAGGYFVDAQLAGANLSGSNLASAVFLRANLASANITTGNLNGANLAGANLTSAKLRLSNLMNANLAGANLTGADITGVTLMNANLTRADLTRANFTGVNLKNAIGLSTANLTNIIWSNTICPDGTISNANRGTCIGHFK
jgi:uncharacterized protein YjbI with pentapeptide repeats